MLRVVSQIGEEPVSLDEVKQYLRVDFTDDDTLITFLIRTAREYCEQILNASLVEKRSEYYLNEFPAENYIKIPKPPLVTVESVTIKDSEGIENTFNDYVVVENEFEESKILATNGWPNIELYPANPIKITYTAGYSTVPEPIKMAILLLITHWYENREIIGQTTSQINFSVNALLSPYRRW